jgi:iron complex outermembrane receptor protein
MTQQRLWRAVAAALALLATAPLAAQQTDNDDDTAEDESANLDSLVVVGSRRVDRSATETPLPVDIIDLQESTQRSPQFDLSQTLQFLSPSFTSVRQTGSDGADLIDSAALRGLGSDQTLVLMNGKRRHSVALVNLFGARNRGNTGTDLNAIPVLAIDRVEILRDGAAAQYGSDAIAGVMNIQLKRSLGCEVIGGWGQYSRGDGENYIGSGYCGFSVGDGGVVSVTAEYQDRGRSDRSEPAGNPRTIGDSKVENTTIYLNGELPLADWGNFYFTGGYQDRDASSAAFARGGLGTDDIPSRNSAAQFPDGFVPFINGDVEDRYAIAGVWGIANDWRWDLSATYGYNELDYTISNTINASIANFDLLNGGPGLSADRFDAGELAFRQNTINLDFSRYFTGIFQGINVAVGGEYRDENYEITAGELGSFVDADGPGGGSAGSQGFPGFQPADETDTGRHNWSGYVDLELDITSRLTAGVAGRFENYSDFGSTLTGKFALGYRATDDLLLRGSISSGFRAPSLQQRLFSSTFTDFISGVPTDVLLAPNGGEVAVAAGIPDLEEETSVSYTLGFTWKPLENLSLTVDGYWIDIDDRVVLSGRFDTTDPNIGQTLQDLGVGEAQFFVNSVDTKTRGFDITLAHDMPLWGGELVTYAAANYNDTDVKSINAPDSLAGREDVLLSDRERLFIENGAPGNKSILAFDYSRGKWNGLFKLTRFGSQTLGTFSGAPVPNAEYSSSISADISLTYSFLPNLRLTVGGANIFDKFPDRQDPDETDNGHIFDSVQFGLNGASYFTRLWYRF